MSNAMELKNANLNAELARLSALVTVEAAEEMQREYGGLTIAGVDDKAGYEAVKKAQKIVKRPRIEIEKLRKELKREALDYGKAVDQRAKDLTALFTATEDHLNTERKRIDDERARLEALRKQEEEIAACWDEAYAANKAFDEAKAEEARLEAQRIEQERREAELKRREEEQQRKEREERIAKEAAEKAKAEAEAEAQRKIAEAEKAAEEKVRQAEKEAERRVAADMDMKESKQKAGTVEVATAPKGAYEALVYDLSKLLGCAESEDSIKEAIQSLLSK